MEKKQQFNLSYILMAVLGVLIIQNLLMAQFRPQVIPYSEFIQAVGQDRVKEISIGTTAIHGKMRDDQGGEIIFKTVRVDNDLAAKLSEHEVKYSGQIENTFFKMLFSWLIPISIFYLIWFFLMRRMQAGPAGMMTLGKNKANSKTSPPGPTTTCNGPRILPGPSFPNTVWAKPWARVFGADTRRNGPQIQRGPGMMHMRTIYRRGDDRRSAGKGQRTKACLR